MSFGKRQSGAGVAAPALNVDMAGAGSQAVSEAAGAPGGPIRWMIVVLACAALLYGLVGSYAPDVLRDHRLAGTWEPAYDLRATDGKCERTNFVTTFCSVRIMSVVRPDQAPIDRRFFMLFSGGGGEALVPVRSTKDRSAVSIFYFAEAKLWNRTLSLIFSTALMMLFGFGALLVLWKKLNS